MELDLYEIDVSGRIFKVNKEILMTIPYFCNMINDSKIDSKNIFVQRLPNIFDHVLSYVIDDNYPFPKEHFYELDFYGIEYNKNKLFDKNDTLIKELTELKDEIEVLKNGNLINNNMIIGIHNKTCSLKCGRLDCVNLVEYNKLFCEGHVKSCVITKCRKEAIEYNYCDEHLLLNSRYKTCKFKLCCYKKVQNKDYCFVHINEK